MLVHFSSFFVGVKYFNGKRNIFLWIYEGYKVYIYVLLLLS